MFIKDHSQILKGAAQNIVYFHNIDVNIDEQNHPPSLKQYRGQQLVVAALVPPLSELLTACKVTISHNSHTIVLSPSVVLAVLQTLHCHTAPHAR